MLSSNAIPIAISARHVHLSQQTIDRLFGTGHVLQVKAPLSQPGQFAAVETVSLVGPRGRHRPAVLGAVRRPDTTDHQRAIPG